jgi:stage V sporulation protein M
MNILKESKKSRSLGGCRCEGGVKMKFYTIKLPKILGGVVKAVLNTFSKN